MKPLLFEPADAPHTAGAVRFKWMNAGMIASMLIVWSVLPGRSPGTKPVAIASFGALLVVALLIALRAQAVHSRDTALLYAMKRGGDVVLTTRDGWRFGRVVPVSKGAEVTVTIALGRHMDTSTRTFRWWTVSGAGSSLRFRTLFAPSPEYLADLLANLKGLGLKASIEDLAAAA